MMSSWCASVHPGMSPRHGSRPQPVQRPRRPALPGNAREEQWTWARVLLATVLGACGASAFLVVGCSNHGCRSDDGKKGSYCERVPIPLEAPLPETIARLEGETLVRQSYSIDNDGVFTLYRSTESRVGSIGARLEALSTKAAKKAGLSPGEGVVLDKVISRGPAADAGLRSGDIVLQYQGKGFLTVDLLKLLVEETPPGTVAALSIQRHGETLEVTLPIVSERQIESGQVFEQSLDVVDEWSRTGMRLVELSAEARAVVAGAQGGGLLVIDVLPGGPAFRSGILPRDVLAAVEGETVSTVEDCARLLGAVPAGKSVPVSLRRGAVARNATLDVVSDAAHEGGAKIPILLEARSTAPRTSFELLWGLLVNTDSCRAVRLERNGAPEAYSATSWGVLLDLIHYRNNSRGQGKLTLFWIIPIWWGG